MQDVNQPITEKKLKVVLEPFTTKAYLKEVLADYPTKKDLTKAFKQNNLEMMELFTTMMNEFEDRDRARHEDMKHYLGALVEDPEDRFLKTGHDRISVCEDRLNKHEARLDKVETVVW